MGPERIPEGRPAAEESGMDEDRLPDRLAGVTTRFRASDGLRRVGESSRCGRAPGRIAGLALRLFSHKRRGIPGEALRAGGSDIVPGS